MSHRPPVWQSVPGLILFTFVLSGAAGGPAVRSAWGQQAPAQQEKLRERDRLGAEAQKLLAAGKLAEGTAAAEKMLKIERQLFGNDHAEVVGSLQLLARLHQQQEEWAAAQRSLQEVVDIQKRRFGEQDWRVTDARLALADVAVRSRLSPAQRQQLRQAKALQADAVRHYQAGRIPQAIPLACQIRDITRETLGEKHPDYALGLTNLAVLYKARGDTTSAERLFRQVVTLRKQTLGDKHPVYAGSLNNLAGLYKGRGDYAKAEPLYRQARDIFKEALGEKHPSYLQSLDTLAGLYRSLADKEEDQEDFASARRSLQQALECTRLRYGEQHWRTTDARQALANLEGRSRLSREQRAQLEQAFTLNARATSLRHSGKYQAGLSAARQARDLYKEVLGEKHPHYAVSLDNLAGLHHEMGDYSRAERLYRQALDIYKEVLGEKHPSYATGLNNLATLYGVVGSYSKAEPLLRQAVAIKKEALGEKHPDYAASLQNLGLLYKKMGSYTRAEPLYTQALAIKKQVLGEKHPSYVLGLNNLALLYWDMGDYRGAEPLLRQVLAVRKQVLGEKHPSYAESLNNLAMLYQDMSDYARAEPLLLQARDIYKEVLGEKHPDYAQSLNNLAQVYDHRGDYDRAAALYRQALDIDRQALGEKHPDYATDLNNLAYLYMSRGDHGKAEPLFLQARDICKRVLGTKHPDYATSLHNLAKLYQAEGDYRRAEPLFREAGDLRKEVLGAKHPDYAASLNDLAFLYRDMGDYARAEPLLLQARDIYKKVLGEEHPDYATCLDSLARLYQDKGDYARAELLFKQVRDIRKQTLGEKHSLYATSLNNLAYLHKTLGDYVRAEALYHQALDIRKAALGEKHPAYAESLNNLAVLDRTLGDYVRAEPLYRQALAIHKEALGEKHPEYALSLNNLAKLHQVMGDYARAEPLYRQALAVRKEVLGEKHPDYAQSLDDLGMLYVNLGDDARAQPLLQQASDIRKEVLGKRHPDYASSLNSLAFLYEGRGDYTRAEPLFQKARDIRKEALGEKHPLYANSLNSLAGLYLYLGDYARAKSLFLQARDLHKQVLGEKHPDYVSSLQNLAFLSLHTREEVSGVPLAHEAVQSSRSLLELTAAVQSERQQYVMLTRSRVHLDNYLRLAAAVRAPGEEVYATVLAWKGAVSARQLHQRLLRHARRDAPADVLELYADLERATARLAVLTQLAPDPKRPEQLRRDLEGASDEVERLQRELARVSAPFRQELRQQQTTPADLRKALPRATALVDVLEYSYYQPPAEGKGKGRWQRRLTAFVLQADKPVVQLDLGGAGPITDAVMTWRRTFGQGEKGTAAAGKLRRDLWDRLEPHLQGMRTVLISPDGVLAQLPWGALPGSKPGTYLLEEYALAVLPMPHLLPSLLSPTSDAAPSSLLLVGDVDFDAAPGRPEQPTLARTAPQGQRSGSRLRWGALPGTADEVRKLAETFHNRFPSAAVLRLEGDRASEQAVRQRTAGRRYVHLATHGFFAPGEVPSALATHAADRLTDDSLFGRRQVTGFHPALLSGLVLAGANRPASADQDDGILTALEVGELDLGGVELATLSACETGLGKKTSGEGLLGLQRAFQIAGARSVAAGLWKVPDRATALLMERFYDNLWQKKMSKLEALRQAQLWLLREAAKEPGLVRGLTRGLDLPEDERPQENRALPPYFWAAFILSGDWR